MLKKIMAMALLMLIAFQGIAFAVETEGDVVFKDALYGAVIGALLGSAVYLVDQDDFGAKLGIGVAVGTIGGLFYGISETRGAVHIKKKEETKFNIPTIRVQKRNDALMVSTTLLRVDF